MNSLIKGVCILWFALSTLAMAKAQEDSLATWQSRTSLGLRLGLNFSDMYYSNSGLNNYESSTMVHGAIGLYGEFSVAGPWAIRPEWLYVGKGQTIDQNGIYYEFNSHYWDWRFPVLYKFNKWNQWKPYLLAGPVIGFALGGTVKYNDGTYSWDTDISDAAIASTEFSFMLGTGAKRTIKIAERNVKIGTEFSYDFGFTDTYSDKEHNHTATALNSSFYDIEGTRKNCGWMVSVSLDMPLQSLLPEKVEAVVEEKPIDTPAVVSPPDEIIEDTVQEAAPPLRTHCYTVEEINALIESESDVDNKVICMSNLNFEFNKSDLDQVSRKYLEEVVKLLNSVPEMKMKITGHADSVGTPERNLELSRERASAAFRHLVSRGINENRLSYQYFGATHPLVDNDTEEHRMLNRRVEFMVFYTATKQEEE